MAVLIPDMLMPGACCACPCSYDNICAVTMRNPSFEEWYESRPDWCPLVEIKHLPKLDAEQLRKLEEAGLE